MKKKIVISTLFLLIMAFNSSDLYAFSTSYVYVYAVSMMKNVGLKNPVRLIR